MYFSSVISSDNTDQESRALVFSLRNIQNFAYNSCLFEFEDIIAEIDAVDIYSPPQFDFPGKLINRLVRHQTKWIKELAYINPYRHSHTLDKEYDIFFAAFDFPWSMPAINSLKNWREKSKFAVCYIVEVWAADFHNTKHLIEFYQKFDLILVSHPSIAKDVAQFTGRPCEYLAPGVNTAKFYPHENKERSIDLISLGCRSSTTHKALLSLAEQKNFFYYYDSQGAAGFRHHYYYQYRTLVANLLKSSRYFITHYSKINQPKRIGDQKVMGYRFVEGAAAGCILLGESPHKEVFNQYFDWEDALIPINFDEPDIADFLAHLDQQPQLLQKIRLLNVVNSLQRHDWVYRWENILEKAGLQPLPAVTERKSQLQKLVKAFSKMHTPAVTTAKT